MFKGNLRQKFTGEFVRLIYVNRSGKPESIEMTAALSCNHLWTNSFADGAAPSGFDKYQRHVVRR